MTAMPATRPALPSVSADPLDRWADKCQAGGRRRGSDAAMSHLHCEL